MRLLALVLLPSCVLLASSPSAAEPALLSGGVQRTKELMHTRVTIAIAEQRGAEELEAAFGAAFAVFERVEEEMNEWKAGTPLARINANAGGEAVSAPANLCDVLHTALDGARRTQGLFDPTWAALRGLWRFGSDAKGFEVPSDAAIAERCALVGWKSVELADEADGTCRVRLTRAGQQLGLGGIAKGWGVDRAVAVLRERGFRNFFVQAGGDLYAAGRKGDRPWRVGIRDPRGPPEKTFAVLEVQDAAFSTSGDYERFVVKDGVRYHHIIDLRTCRPASQSRSATVLARSATEAEILTKSVFILGPAEGLALAERLGAGAVVVDAKNRVHVSRSLEKRVRHWAPTP